MATPRRTLSDKERKFIKERDNCSCHLCGIRIEDDEYFEVDHVWPLAKNGPDTWENMRVAHYLCNYAKGDLWMDDPELPYLINDAVDKRAKYGYTLVVHDACKQCGKDISDRHGKSWLCEECFKSNRRSVHKAWRDKNPEKIKAWSDIFSENNPTYFRDRLRRIRDTEPERHAEYLRQRRIRRFFSLQDPNQTSFLE